MYIVNIDTCGACEGAGHCSDLCTTCNGSGEGMYDGSYCSTCGGSGECDDTCTICEGSGKSTPEHYYIYNVNATEEQYEVLPEHLVKWQREHIYTDVEYEIELIPEQGA